MTKISTYSLDEDVVGGDKWIGSDIQNQNRTKNFTPDKLALYFNDNQIVNIGMPIQYKYYTLDPLEVRPIGTLTFETEIGSSVPFSTITTFLLSKYTTKQNDVSQFLDFLNESKVLLYRSNDINQFGFYKILTLEPYILDPTFFVLTVDYIDGNGSMLEDKDYMISLVSLNEGAVPTKTSDLINDGQDGIYPFITAQDIPNALIFTSPLVDTAGTITINQSGLSSDGYLSSTDWNTFNGKENVLTFSSPLVRTIDAISIPKASDGINGYLSGSDWTTFMNKQSALLGTGFVKSNAGVISYDTNTYYLASNPDGFITSASLTGYVPTSRTLTINGTAYDLTADRTWSVGTVTSVDLSMPPAFTVSNNPVTGAGTITVSGAGTAAQYIRGDGKLATLPSGGGGGSSVNYYLNGSVNASVATYKQLSNTAIIGAGTDFTLTGNGLISQFLTDVGNPNRTEIPSGAWNFEMFFSMSSNGGTPAFYVELLKYDGATFTTIANNSAVPETINGGTSIDLYLTSLAVPTTPLLVTDRLAIRVYIVNNSGGRTATLHTENSHLCEIITTFSGGVTSLNGLTANTQYLAVGTSGTDFNINSLVDTHTFNLPTASSVNRGALSSTDWTTFNSKFDLPSLTAGSVLFSNGTTIAQDNANFFWDDSNKRLGIGTTSPSEILQVGGLSGAAATPTAIRLDDTYRTGGDAFNKLKFYLYKSSTETYGLGLGDLADIQYWAGTISTGTHRFFTSQTERMRITSGGNVGIGTTNPSYKLDIVGGDALINSVKIGLGGGNIASNIMIGNSNTINTGVRNLFIGNGAGQSNTTAPNNSFAGYNSGLISTIGLNNSFFGAYTGYVNTLGNENAFFGYRSGYSNISASGNSFFGNLSGYNINGSFNTAIGNAAGRFISGGSVSNINSTNSIYLGAETKALADSQTNQIVIGYNAIGLGSNSVVLGNDSIVKTALKGDVGIGTTSPSTKLDVNGVITATGGNSTSWNAKQDAITLTTTGTSGAATLVGSTLNIPQYNGGGGLSGVHSILPIISNEVTSFTVNAVSLTSVVNTIDRMTATLYYPAQNITTLNLFINVTTLAAGALAKISIYSDNNGVPQNLLYTSTDLNLSTIGKKTATVTFNFISGTKYWMVVHTNSGVAAFSNVQVSALLPLKNLASNGQTVGTYIAISTFASGTPSVFPSGVWSTVTMPFIGITKE
jgi:hypothetical protein